MRDEFFMKLALAPPHRGADQIALINKQRRHYLNTMRDLSNSPRARTRTTGWRTC